MNGRSSTAHSASSDPQAASVSATGSTGCTIQIATASSSTPKNCFTPSIQGPAFGSSAPAEAPTSSSGTLIPTASANSALPPSITSRVWLRYTSAPASGAATQGLTINADSPPIRNTPAMRPPRSRCPFRPSRRP